MLDAFFQIIGINITNLRFADGIDPQLRKSGN